MAVDDRDPSSTYRTFSFSWSPTPTWPINAVTPTVTALLGYAPEDITSGGVTFAQLIHAEDRAALSTYLQAADGVTRFQTCCRLRHRDGQWRYFEGATILEPAPDGEGGLCHTYLLLTDNPRDGTPMQYDWSRSSVPYQRYRDLFDTAFDPILVVDLATGKLIDANRKAEQLTGYTRSELLQMHQSELHPESERAAARELFRTEHLANEFGTFEFVIERKDGRRVPVEICPSQLRLSDGRTVIRGTFRDITLQRETETTLRRAAEEKDVLLREVHHRVKNNLQIIISLLRLQARNVSSREAARALSDSHTRVRAMALVHESLHGSENLRDLSLRDYLGRLLQGLQEALGRRGTGAAVTFEADDIAVLPDQASPLGLAVNELLTNAVQHARPASGQLRVQVRLSVSNDTIQLAIADNGVPPDDPDALRHSLGLSLVRSLVERQLGGSFALDMSEGTRALIRIPRTEVAP